MRKEIASLVNKTVHFYGELLIVEDSRFLLKNVRVAPYYNNKSPVECDHIWIYEGQTEHKYKKRFKQKNLLIKHAGKGAYIEMLGTVCQYSRRDRSIDYGIIAKPCICLETKLKSARGLSPYKQEKILEELLNALKNEHLLYGIQYLHSQVKSALNGALKKTKQSIRLSEQRIAKQFRGRLHPDPITMPKERRHTAQGFFTKIS